MRQDGVAEDLDKVWTLGPADMALIAGLPDAGRLGLAAQLAHWRAHGRFPDDEADLGGRAAGRHLAAGAGCAGRAARGSGLARERLRHASGAARARIWTAPDRAGAGHDTRHEGGPGLRQRWRHMPHRDSPQTTTVQSDTRRRPVANHTAVLGGTRGQPRDATGRPVARTHTFAVTGPAAAIVSKAYDAVLYTQEW